MTILTALSGNEIYCIAQKNFQPGEMVLGNSVSSLGLRGMIGTEVTMPGLELKDIGEMIRVGRQAAFQKMVDLAKPGLGVIAVTNDLVVHSNHIEFLSSGSSVQNAKNTFSTSADGKKFYIELDAGYEPISFAFGNVVYATGTTGGLLSKFKTFSGGENKKLSEVFNETRGLALKRMIKHAKEKNANAIMGIQTTTSVYSGVNEMLMVGTAAHNDQLTGMQELVTSNLNAVDLWNLAKLGYAPLQLMLSSSVFSFGFGDNVISFLKSFNLDEDAQLTQFMDETRKNTLNRMREEAAALGADAVVNVKNTIYKLGNGLIEFLAMGTAIKKFPQIKTESKELIQQAVI